MTRSHRHTRIVGHAIASSEKYDKQAAARRERKTVKDHLKPHIADEPDFDIEEHCYHPRSGQWTFSKDGKGYIGNRNAKLMRK